MALKRVALVAVVVCAALVPATTASGAHHRHAKLHLGRVPLQLAQLGPAAASFALNYGSGPISNSGFFLTSDSSSSSGGGILSSGGFLFPSALGGYVLDYGDPYTGSAGVTEIRTSVEVYRSRRSARAALRFATFDELFSEFLSASPFTDTQTKKYKPVHVGQRRHGSVRIRTAPDLNPIVTLDEQVADGRFVLDVTITAGSVSAAKNAAPHLLRLLHHRLQLMLQGHKLAKAPPLPHEPKEGQAPGGPDLSTLILQPTDIGQSHAVNLFQLYVPAPPALSDFLMLLAPAGTYEEVAQQIAWWPTATEATYAEAYGGGWPYGFSFGASEETGTPVDLSAVGHGAVGVLVTDDDGESTAYVRLTNGQAGESIVAYSESTLQASDVQSLAQAAADRLDAGLGP